MAQQQWPMNMPAVPAAALRPFPRAGESAEEEALRQFLAERGLEAHCGAMAASGVRGLSQLRAVAGDAAAVQRLFAATQMPKGHQLKLRKALLAEQLQQPEPLPSDQLMGSDDRRSAGQQPVSGFVLQALAQNFGPLQ